MARELSIVAAALAIALSGGIAAATESSLPPLPAPQQGNQLELPRIAPQAPPTAPQTGDQSDSTLELPLPQTFSGCWQGVVSHVDSMERFRSNETIEWMPKKYRICYEKTAGGPFRPTFSEAGILHADTQVSNVKSILRVISTDGRASANLRGLLHFDEVPMTLFGFSSSTAHVDELTNMNCTIQGGVMHVEARLYGQWNGQPWVMVTWHADFTSVPD